MLPWIAIFRERQTPLLSGLEKCLACVINFQGPIMEAEGVINDPVTAIATLKAH